MIAWVKMGVCGWGGLDWWYMYMYMSMHVSLVSLSGCGSVCG